MATTVYTNNQHYSDIAAAIRNKNGTNTTYKPSEMAAAINALIVSGASINLQAKTVSPTTSQQVVTYDNAYNGLSQVTVNAIQTETKSATPSTSAQTITPASGKYLTSVSIAAIQTETKSATPSTSTQNITPSSGKYLTKVTVNPIPSNYIVPTGSYSIVANGTGIDIAQYATVDVNVPTGSTINNQSNKTVSPSTSQQIITYDSGYTGLEQVTVGAMPTMTLPTAASGTSAGTSKATISRSTSDQYINIPTGYNSAAVYYKVSAVPNGSAGTPTVQVSYDADEGEAYVTPKVTNTTGYITGGTKTGSQVTIDVSDLVSGTLNISTWGTWNVAPYESAKVPMGTAGTPSATKGTVSNNSISVTPSVTNITGFITGSTKTGTAVTVTASELVSGTKTIVANETGIDVTNYASVDVSVPVGGTINNQSNKTVTPTKSQQIITYDSGYTGLAQVTVSAIPAAYITTSDADAIAANILLNKTAYVNGSKITGTMANNGATGGTITTQGGTYTIPAGYTSGGTVTASLAAGSTTTSNISGAAFEETTGDYGFRTSVQIQPGYYASATTITKDFSSMLPAPDTEGTAAQVLAGYDLYNHNGQLISGTMTNNSIGTITLDQTTTSYTIPAGYHDGTGKVQHTTVNIPDPTISINSSTGVITASGSWTRGFTTDNSYSKTYSLSIQAAATITPSETLQTAVAAGKYTTGIVTVAAIPNDYVGSGITQRSSSDLSASGATVTAPAGYYSTAASKSVASMTLPTAATSSASSGYASKATITPSTSAQYINIPTGYNSAGAYYKINAMTTGSTTGPSSLSGSSATVTTGTNTITLTKTGVTTTPTVSAGYISSATASTATVTLTASVTTKDAATITPTTTNQTIASGTYLTGTQTIAGDANLIGSNIISGKSIFGVAGTVVFQTIYSGTSTPNASTGVNGDIYIKTA